eukprot:6466232-Amphidinium_carterae.1
MERVVVLNCFHLSGIGLASEIPRFELEHVQGPDISRTEGEGVLVKKRHTTNGPKLKLEQTTHNL